MDIFLYSIGTRVLAACFGVYIGHELWRAFTDRKITFSSGNLLDCSTSVFHRDQAPVRYWIQVSLEVVVFLACVVTTIFGWSYSN